MSCVPGGKVHNPTPGEKSDAADVQMPPPSRFRKSFVWGVTLAATLAIVLAVAVGSCESDEDAWKDEVERLDRQAVAMRAKKERLKARRVVDGLMAAKSLGLSSGASIEAHGTTWRVTKVDSPGWIGLAIHVLCEPTVTEKQLRAFLSDYRDGAEQVAARNRGGGIFVFHSASYEAADFRIACLHASKFLTPDVETRISINRHIVKGLHAPRKKRLGLSHAARQQVYALMSQAETAASKVAEKEVPNSMLGAAATNAEHRAVLIERGNREDAAVEREFTSIAKMYGLTLGQLYTIYGEGVENGWLGQ